MIEKLCECSVLREGLMSCGTSQNVKIKNAIKMLMDVLGRGNYIGDDILL